MVLLMYKRGEIMKLNVTSDAAKWYIKEMDLKPGDSIKFFGKVYGPHGGFSFAISKMDPSRPFVLETVEGINFYIEKSDDWFFIDKDLTVSLDTERNEPTYEVIVKEEQ